LPETEIGFGWRIIAQLNPEGVGRLTEIKSKEQVSLVRLKTTIVIRYGARLSHTLLLHTSLPCINRNSSHPSDFYFSFNPSLLSLFYFLFLLQEN